MANPTLKSIVLSLFFLVLGMIPQAALCAEGQGSVKGQYFLVVWASQGRDGDVLHSHTFASFYRGDDLARGVVHPVTISWLPTDGVVHPFSLEKGHNFSLDETLRMACRSNWKVVSWGPYKIRPELYRSAMRRVRELRSGHVRYSMMNAFSGSMNCIIAAGDITPVPLDTGILWGVAASAAVVQHLSPYFLKDGGAPKSLAEMTTATPCQKVSDTGLD